MKVKIQVLTVLIIGMVISCRTLKEVKTLSKCEFALGSLEKPVIAGVKVYEKEHFSDLTVKDIAKITASFVKGELPLEFLLNLDVKNPNAKTAAINRIEWIAYIDDIEVCAGELNERIEVPPGNGMATIPLTIKTDIMKVTSHNSVNSLVNFGLNLADAGNTPTRVTIEIKPSLRIGKKQISYPGFIKVNKEFSSE